MELTWSPQRSRGPRVASDSRPNCVGTSVPPLALRCQTSFLFPVRGFAVLITAPAPTPGLSWFQRPHHLLLLPAFCFFCLNRPDSRLRYRRGRWDTRLLVREPARLPLCQLSGRDILGSMGVTNPGPPPRPGAAASPPVTQGRKAPASASGRGPSLLPGAAASPAAGPRPLRSTGGGGERGSSALGTGTRAPTGPPGDGGGVPGSPDR